MSIVCITPATAKKICLILSVILRVVSSVGLEHHVDNVRVAGSSPAQPTGFLLNHSINPSVNLNNSGSCGHEPGRLNIIRDKNCCSATNNGAGVG